MAEIDRIVQVTITRESSAINTASFNSVLILTEDQKFDERTRTYTDFDALASDFDSTDSAYIIGQRVFGQTGARPASVVVGRKEPEDAETWVEALDAVIDENNLWYALVAATHVQEDVMALAGAIQARKKIYGTSTQDPASLTSGLSDTGALLDAAGYNRTFIVYTPAADIQYPEAAWIGSQLAYTPGSNTWKFKQAAGITVGNPSDSGRANLRLKHINMLIDIAGLNQFVDGWMADGTWIDEIVFQDWLEARLKEGVFFRLANTLKVPYTNPGFTIIENEIRAVLSLAEANGGIDRGWTVTTPDVLSVPATQRAQRIAGTFRFRARLAGAVHSVIIEGVLTI